MTTYDYDDAGNLTEKVDAKGQMTIYSYDNAGRLSGISYYATTVSPLVKSVTFAYDEAGRLIGYEDKDGNEVILSKADYDYDAAGRKSSDTVNYGGFSKSNAYTYLKNGLKDTFTGPDNATYTYTYDTANRLVGVEIPGAGFLTINDYNWNRPAAMTLPGGGTREVAYDPLMRTSQITAKDPGGNNLLNYAYTHDNMDNITDKTTEHGDYGYIYDALHRLTDVDNPEAAGLIDEAFTYDNAGNRLTSADRDGDWTYNDNNELLSLPGLTGSGGLQAAIYEYDANGNTVRKTEDGVDTIYIYNTEDRLTEVRTGSGSLTASYYYDPFGRRLSKTAGGTTTYYHYADEGLVAEMDAAGNVARAYGWQPGGTWGTDPLFCHSREGGNPEYYFYHNDHLGTPQKLTASNGAVVWSAKYDSFGEAVVEIETVENNLRFPGQYYDDETGLHYNCFRYYSPEVGRYLRVDPVGICLMKRPSDRLTHLYLYVYANPIANRDPRGLKSVKGSCSTATIAAGIKCGEEYEKLYEAARNEINDCQKEWQACWSAHPPTKCECEEMDKLKTPDEALKWCRANSKKWATQFSDTVNKPGCRDALENALINCLDPLPMM